MGQKSVAVGLKILINQKKICQGKADVPNNVLIMYSSRFTKVKPIFHTNPAESISIEHNCSFLKYCFLCNKTLRLDKEVYMYKGDLGFCSVECRNRQIYLDEIKELENCTKKMLRSFRRCGDDGRRRCSETSALLDEYKQRRNPLAYSKKNTRPIFTFS
ncbi:FCS-Like Zinc finger 17-like [Solanum dulcamara]|uniref:FCS-Like Zinc finger 17-like n=1 Tax=Solanum dulcamara TaxID=45834 RepID=UPI0024854999|nr:FCS-Like Zinc finger 17-like [Solanum dulcamara]